MDGGAASLAKCDCVTQLAQKPRDLSITVALPWRDSLTVVAVQHCLAWVHGGMA